IGNLLLADFLHHAAGRGRPARLDLSAFLKGPSGGLTIVADALLINPGAADALGGRVRDLLLAAFRDHLAHRVGHLGADLGAFLEGAASGFAIIADALLVHVRADQVVADGVRDLDRDGIGHLLANRIGHLRADLPLHVGRAGDLAADAVLFPNLAAAL